MKKTNLISTTSMTPVERAQGRFMRAPDHPGESSQTEASSTESGNEADNSGQDDLSSTFWNEPEADRSNSSSKDSASSDSSSSGQNEFGQQLAAEIQGMQFVAPFNNEIAEQINEGNLDGINDNISAMVRSGVQQAVVSSAKLMQAQANQMMEMVRAEIAGALGNKDSKTMLESEFASYKDPTMQRQIDGIFAQSMKHTNNDRAKAVEMTRDMLKFMGKTAAADMGLDIPAGGRGNEGPSAGSQSLIDELMGR